MSGHRRSSREPKVRQIFAAEPIAVPASEADRHHLNDSRSAGACGLNQPGRLFQEGDLHNRVIHSIGSQIREILKLTGNWDYDRTYDSYRYKPIGRPAIKDFRFPPNQVTSFEHYDLGLGRKYMDLLKTKYQIDDSEFELGQNYEIDRAIVSQMHQAAADVYDDVNFNPIPTAALAGGLLRVRVEGDLILTNEIETALPETQVNEDNQPRSSGGLLADDDDESQSSDEDTDIFEMPSAHLGEDNHSHSPAARTRVGSVLSLPVQGRSSRNLAVPSRASTPRSDGSPLATLAPTVRAPPQANTRPVPLAINENIPPPSSSSKDETIEKLIRKIKRRDEKIEQAADELAAEKRKYRQLEQQLAHEQEKYSTMEQELQQELQNEKAANKKLKSELDVSKRAIDDQKFELEEARLDWQEKETHLQRQILDLKKHQRRA